MGPGKVDDADRYLKSKRRMDNPTLQRLEDQISWYDSRSLTNQRWFKWLMLAEITCAAFVPLFAGIKVPPIYTGMLGVTVVILQSLQQLNQYQHNWITYRSTCENLKHEKFFFLAKAGPYTEAPDPLPLLAERIESLISQEHAKWVSARKQGKSAPVDSQHDLPNKVR